MSGGTVETEEAETGGLKIREYTCSECGATGREWIMAHQTEWNSNDDWSTVRRVDLSDEKWAEARGTWPGRS